MQLWIYLLLAAVMYAVSSAGMYWLYWRAYAAMMNVWGVTAENVSRAPIAVQLLDQWSGVPLTLMQNGCLIAASFALNRITRRSEKMRGALVGAGAGAAVVALAWVLLMLTGSIRLGWRLSKPAFSVSTPVLLVTTLAEAAGKGCCLYSAVYGEMKSRLCKWAALVIAVVIATGLEAISGGIQVVFLINAALTALVCCLLTDRGNAAATGFLFAREFISQVVLGFAGYEAALYESYPVNLYWLNGGNNGPDNGLMMTVILLTLVALMVRKRKIGPIIKPAHEKKEN